MGNWMNGLARFEEAHGGELNKVGQEAFRAGVEWGRKDMLLQAVRLMQDMHDEHADKYGAGLTNEFLSGYQMAEKLMHDWTPSNVKCG